MLGSSNCCQWRRRKGPRYRRVSQTSHGYLMLIVVAMKSKRPPNPGRMAGRVIDRFSLGVKVAHTTRWWSKP